MLDAGVVFLSVSAVLGSLMLEMEVTNVDVPSTVKASEAKYC